MEHPLHVLGAVLVVTGLARLRRPIAPLRLLLGVVICATIRFEGLALALLGIAALFWARRPAQGFLAAAAVALTLGAYMAYMTRLGLPLLPSSVLSKSTASAALSQSDGFGFVLLSLRNAAEAFGDRWGLLLALAASLSLFALVGAFGRVSSEDGSVWRPVALVVALALLAHVALGRYGWFGRYEVYAVATGLMGLMLVFSRGLRAIAARRPFGPLFAPAMLLLVAAPYHYHTLVTPAATRAVRDQHYQMHRFATEFFPETVAVNDLGWVAYRNDAFVLDLIGLGSERARRLRASPDTTAADIAGLADDHGAAFAMIYPSWFEGQVPPEWCAAGRLASRPVSAASGVVDFFLIDLSREAAFRSALAAFAATLPDGVSLVQLPCRLRDA